MLAIILCPLLAIGAVILLVDGPIDGSAYLLGAGKPVTVTLTEPGWFSQSGRHNTENYGRGYYIEDGHRVPVAVHGDEGRDEVNGRLALVNLSLGNPLVYTRESQAWWDVADLVGVFMLGGFAYVFLRLARWHLGRDLKR